MVNPTETKTIMEFVRELPNVDVTSRWERFWEILTAGKDQVAAKFPVELHPSCAGREYYQSKNGEFEGSFNAYSGPEIEWLVHSWLGNRRNSLLDMNLTVFAGPQTTVPHLRIIFGTFPRLYFSADYMPRRNLWVDEAYLKRYYARCNDEYLKFKADERYDWFISQSPYVRAAESPTAISISIDHDDSVIDEWQEYTEMFISRWLTWFDDPERIPEPLQAEQQRFDHELRDHWYRLDPMNQHAVPAFGAAEVERLVQMRMGQEQMQASRLYD
jgi:hypothetical protein